MNPLVSVITGTRDRHDEVRNAIRQVRGQTYRPIEHVIVSDGPDSNLREILEVLCCDDLQNDPAVHPNPREVPIVYAETGRVWSDEMTCSDGAAAFQVAQLLAHGPLQMWLSDDEEMDSSHVEQLVGILQRTSSDFAYSRALWYTADRPGLPRLSYVIGTDPPRPDQLTNCLYRTALLDYAKFETHHGRGTDWYQVDGWIKAGARYAFLDAVTFRHRADQVGGVNSNVVKQPLRGHSPAVHP